MFFFFFKWNLVAVEARNANDPYEKETEYGFSTLHVVEVTSETTYVTEPGVMYVVVWILSTS